VRAIRAHEFGPPEIMRREEFPDLKINTGQILVYLQSAGVNPFDTYIRSGTYAIESTDYGKIVLIS
jgi:NADPH2:quinone reductase